MHPLKWKPTRFGVPNFSHDAEMIPNLMNSIWDSNVGQTGQRYCTEVSSRENRLRKFENLCQNLWFLDKKKCTYEKCCRSFQSYWKSKLWLLVKDLAWRRTILKRTSTENTRQVNHFRERSSNVTTEWRISTASGRIQWLAKLTLRTAYNEKHGNEKKFI